MNWEDYNKGIEEGRKHSSSSRETRDKLNNIENNCIKNTTKFSQMLKEIKTETQKIAEDIKEIKNELKQNYITNKEFNPYKDKVNRLVGFLWALLIGCGVIISRYLLKQAGLD